MVVADSVNSSQRLREKSGCSGQPDRSGDRLRARHLQVYGVFGHAISIWGEGCSNEFANTKSGGALQTSFSSGQQMSRSCCVLSRSIPGGKSGAFIGSGGSAINVAAAGAPRLPSTQPSKGSSPLTRRR